MDATGGHMLNEVIQKVACFLSYVEYRSKRYKYIQNKHINWYVEHVSNCVITLWKLGKEGKEKNDRVSVMSWNITSVKVEDIRMCVESYWKLGWRMGSKVVRENNGTGCSDQNKVYSQWGYTEKPLWTST
jgi:hypothetical protein